MAVPIFQQQEAGNPLYFLTYNGVVEYAAAYFTYQGTSSAISFPDSWSTIPGVYVFFSEAPTNQPAFATSLNQYLNTPGHTNVRFVWIRNPNLPANEWGIEAISYFNNLTYQKAQFSFGGYLLEIGGGCSIALSTQADDYVFVITQPQTQNCFFETKSGAFRYPLPAGNITLDYHHSRLGCLSFSLAMQNGVATYPNFDTMDMGCRYYINNSEYAGYLRSLRYPVFEPPASPIQLLASLNPAHHFDSGLSFFSLFPPVGSPPALNSWYRTNMGQQVALTPLATAQFVFAIMPETTSSSPADPYTLVPMGDFTISVSSQRNNGAAKDCLMPGISGVEYVGLTGGGNQLSFVPRQAAYAPAFSLQTELSVIEVSRYTGLTDIATTAWVYFSASNTQEINYYAQAENSLLYKTDQGGVLAPYLGYLEVLNGTLPPSGAGIVSNTSKDSLLKAFPSVPYPGIETDKIEIYRQFETQILNPARRQIIGGLLQALPPPQPGDVIGVTPQGLKMDWDTSCTYLNSITIADTGNQTGTNSDRFFQFTGIKGLFRSALLTNQLFLVITNAAQFFNSASINYKLSRRAMTSLSEAGFPAALLCKLKANPSLEGQWYKNITDYTTALLTKLTQTEFDQYTSVLTKCGAYAFIEIGGDTSFELTKNALQSINVCGSNASIPDQLITQLINAATIANKKFDTYTQFQAAVAAVINNDNWNLYGLLLTEYARMVSGSWTFDCSPYIWENPAGKTNPGPDDPNTMIIFKYADSSLESLAADTSTWIWPEAAQKNGGSVAQTQKAIIDIINDAKSRAETQKDFANFKNVVTEPGWNGILILNCGVLLDQLPEELKGIVAGIDPARFYGHHAGVNVTPVITDGGILDVKHSSLFGLINFDDPDDQFYQGVPYAFKVLSLKVLFLNSVVSNFYSQVEIMISELYGEQSVLTDQSRGDNLILNGLYQKQDGKASYTFLIDSDSIFFMVSKVLENVEITHAEFVTLIPPEGSADSTVHAQFILNGRLRFKELDYFDCFSFGSTTDADNNPVDGWLSFRNLLINMDFRPGAGQTFSFVSNKVFCDLFNSKPRPLSFYNHFPLQLSSAVQSDQRQLPGDMGFMSVSSPLQQGGFTGLWFGFVYNLDLGTLGSLTSDIGLTVQILMSWGPSADKYNVYVGLNLPGSSSANTEIPIEGILKMVFKKIEITAKEQPAPALRGTQPPVTYMLKFKGISLSLLGLRFPPGAIDMYIFGNPEQDRSAVGWYAAYSKDKDKEEKKINTLLSLPRQLK